MKTKKLFTTFERTKAKGLELGLGEVPIFKNFLTALDNPNKAEYVNFLETDSDDLDPNLVPEGFSDYMDEVIESSIKVNELFEAIVSALENGGLEKAIMELDKDKLCQKTE